MTCSYKLQELVILAYPNFDEPSRSTIARDCFIKVLSPDMQVALKSICNYPTKSIKDLVTETSRLEIAGIKARPPVVKNDVFEVSANISLIDAITKRVLECIQSQNMETSLSPGVNKSNSKSSEAFESVDYVSKSFNSGRYQGGVRYQGIQNKRRGKTRAYGFFTPTTQTHMKCRPCQSTVIAQIVSVKPVVIVDTMLGIQSA